MIVELHGDRVGGRAVGKPRTLVAGSRGDPTTVGGLARMAMLSRVWKLTPPVGDDHARAYYFLKARLPMVAALLSRAAIVALTRPVPLGGCSWCLAAFYSATSFGAWEPPEDDDLYRSFLGSKCGRCRVAFQAVEVANREREHTDQLVAAGLAPVAARRIRSAEELQAQVAAIRRLEQARPPQGPAPNGVIWPAGQEPAGVTAALTRRRRPRR
jgi:hypothetical protein